MSVRSVITKSLLLLGGSALSVLAYCAITTDVAQAQSVSQRECNTVIVFDRSGSVGGPNLEVLREQTRRLFQPGGLDSSKINVAFWSFSDEYAIDWTGAINKNFNAPFHDFVSSKGVNSSFNNAMNAMTSVGGTNYQQGFGYQGNIANPYTQAIVDRADIITFLTDGDPNWNVGGGLEGGRIAAQKHRDAGRVTIGGIIGKNPDMLRNLNYVLTNDLNNAKDSFQISSNYSDLSRILTDRIEKKCKELNPPCQYDSSILADDPSCVPRCQFNPNIPNNSPQCFPPCPYNTTIPQNDPRCVKPPYELKPSTSSSSSSMSSNDSVGLTYTVDNKTAVRSDPTGWSITQVVVEKGQSVDRLKKINDSNPDLTYADGLNCTELLQKVNRAGTCKPNIASGTKVFDQNKTTTLAPSDGIGGAASTLVIDDAWPVGTKVCYLLSIDRPTENDTPRNRYGNASCITIGKRPTVQVWGGDVRVGSGAANTGDQPGIKTALTIRNSGIFGSWSEYGAFAPGKIVGFSTASGLANEGPTGFPYSGGDPFATRTAWSKLTFANKTVNPDDEYGNFSSTGIDSSTTASNIVKTTKKIADTGGVFNVSSLQSGLYENPTGDVVVEAGDVPAGKSIVLYVPKGKVTIAGDIKYANGPFRSAAEIPQFIIIAKNIDINSNVGRVDSWLLAQSSDDDSGVISTCETKSGLTIDTCSKQLRINGPIVAKRIHLLRTEGGDSKNDQGTPTEIINYRADALLWAYGSGRSEQRVMTTHTTELPVRY